MGLRSQIDKLTRTVKALLAVRLRGGVWFYRGPLETAQAEAEKSGRQDALFIPEKVGDHEWEALAEKIRDQQQHLMMQLERGSL